MVSQYFSYLKPNLHDRFLSSTAAPLYVSYTIHNIIAWLKIKPFLPRWGARIFLITIIVVQPYWILEMWANFEYFNMLGSKIFETSRFFEPLMRLVVTPFQPVALVLMVKIGTPGGCLQPSSSCKSSTRTMISVSST